MKDQTELKVPTVPTFHEVVSEIKHRSTLTPNSTPIKIELQLSIRITSPKFPHYTNSHPPTILPVVQSNPIPQVVGVLELLAPSGRPDSYSRQTLVNTQAKTPYGIHRDSTEVFVIPKNGTFVCFAEDSIVYRLPNHTPEEDGTDRCGLQLHSFPLYSEFHPIDLFQVTDNLKAIQSQLEAIQSLVVLNPASNQAN